MPDLYLFADTNLFLQCKVLQEIDWSQLGTFHHIEVVVCRTVQLEIDALKDARDAGALTELAAPRASYFRSPKTVLNKRECSHRASPSTSTRQGT